MGTENSSNRWFAPLLPILFPEQPRALPGRRGLKVALRAAHVLCAGILVGSYVFDAEAALKSSWTLATVASGIAILLLDLHESAAFLFQVRGLVVAVKLTLLAALPLFPDEHQPWVLGLLVVISVLSSHAPSRVRYRVLLFRDRVRAGNSKG